MLLLNRYLNPDQFLCFDAMDVGGGGGGGPVDAGGGGGAPIQPVTVTDDSVLQFPGAKEPVKYSDWQKQYVGKSEYTKATQEAARLRAENARLTTAQQAAAQVRQTPLQGQPQPSAFQQQLAALENAPYVDGKTAAALAMSIVNQGIAPLAQELQKRDAVIGLLAKKLQGLDGTVTGLSGRSSATDMAQKFSQVRSSVGLPEAPVINDFVQDIYYSHEGEDLEREFPNMVKQRWNDLVAAVRSWDKQRAQDARTARLGIPGRGGNGTPGSPAKRPFESAEDIAKTWFPMISGQADAT